VQEKIGFLSKYLGYELQSAERYRRFVSVVMVGSSGREGKVKKLLSHHLRISDVMADFDGAAMILMSETNSAGALTAIERYKNGNDEGHDLRFSLVTYPSDGGGADGMIATAFRRLQKADGGQSGSVVMTG
jgi:hypothetical protein